MGRKVAEAALPLSRGDRQQIITDLEKLPENVRGTRVDTLVAWVETALIVSLDDIFEHRHELTAAIEQVRIGVEKLVAGASAVAPFLQPKTTLDCLERKEHQPWSGEFNVLQAVIHRLGLGPTEDIAENSLDRISRSVRLLTDLPPIFEAPIDDLKFAKDTPTIWLVRAVMYYRHKQRLKLTINWNRASDAPKGSHRENRHMSPSSDSSKLVEAVAKLFRFDTPNRTLSQQMMEYRAFYEASEEGIPAYYDFASPLRYLNS